jgi:hypothetical protein
MPDLVLYWGYFSNSTYVWIKVIERNIAHAPTIILDINGAHI